MLSHYNAVYLFIRRTYKSFDVQFKHNWNNTVINFYLASFSSNEGSIVECAVNYFMYFFFLFVAAYSKIDYIRKQCKKITEYSDQ